MLNCLHHTVEDDGKKAPYIINEGLLKKFVEGEQEIAAVQEYLNTRNGTDSEPIDLRSDSESEAERNYDSDLDSEAESDSGSDSVREVTQDRSTTDLRSVRNKLQQEVENLESYILEGDNPRGSIYYITPDEDMRKRQRAVEEADEVNPTAVIPPVNDADTLKEAWDEMDFEKVVELASQEIEEHTSAPLDRDYAGVQQLCAGLQRRFKAYRAMKLFSLAAADAERAFQLLAEFGVNSETNLDLFSVDASEPTSQGQNGKGTKRRRIENQNAPSPVASSSLLSQILVHLSPVSKNSAILATSRLQTHQAHASNRMAP